MNRTFPRAPILTAAQMRAAEQAAIDSGAVTGLELMERAGAGVVQAILARWPDLAEGGHHALVLCGPGNNGGDGFVIARLLRARGWRVAIFLLGDPARMPPDARANHDRLAAGPEILPLAFDALRQAFDAACAAGETVIPVVDALFGTGQRGPLDEVLAPVNRLIDHAMSRDVGAAPVFVAVDMPTGYDTDTGAALARRPLPADLTVTFHRAKPVHTMPHMLDADLVIADIGL